ncbi:MAG: hypothetical protein K5894_09835 [Lachnospiraceae bacterium]|nr:hypothetical protein [Lachnospiraceae bacterium]
MKEPDSLKIVNVASAEEAEEASYVGSAGIDEYADAASAKNFSIPCKLYVFDGNGEILSEDQVTADGEDLDCEITDVSTEEDGDNTKVSVAYKVNKTIGVTFKDYYGDFNGSVINSNIEVYDSVNGSSVVINVDNTEYNDGWTDWKDDSHIDYIVDYTYKAGFTVPTERLETTVINFGDRKASDAVRIKLTDLLKD